MVATFRTATAHDVCCTGPSSSLWPAPSCCPIRRPTMPCGRSRARSASTWKWAWSPFIVTIFVLGFFMALGKAAVFKHIPVYYPNNVGAVGGMVGMIGGLGGFVLPIAFGALVDLTGLWTSCFMLLFCWSSARSGLDARCGPRRWSAALAGEALKKLPELPEMEAIHEPEHIGALSGAVLTDWRPEDKTFWETSGPRHRAAQSLDFDSGLLLSFAIWMVWSVVVAKLPAVGFKFTTGQLFWLAAHARHVRRGAAHLLFLHAADLRRTAVDYACDLVADDSRRRHRLSPCRRRRRRIRIFLALALLCGLGGGNFASSMANISLLLPARGEGQRARAQRRSRQSRRQRRAVRGPAGDHGRRVRLVRRRSAGRDATGARAALAAERRLHLGAVHRRQRLRRMVRHERHRRDEGIVRRPGGDLPAQAQLDHVLALHRHLRLVHRLFGGLPAAGQDPVPERRRAAIRLHRAAGRRAVALGHRLGCRQMGRRARHLVGVRA